MYTLVGVDGNAYSVMGYTARAMKTAGFTQEEVDKMHKEATSSDYFNLLIVCGEYIDKVNEKLGLTEEDGDEYDDE